MHKGIFYAALEGDGSIIKINPEVEIMVSSDGRRMSRRTEGQIDAFTDFVRLHRWPDRRSDSHL